jgi:FkbM family methyltransferase
MRRVANRLFEWLPLQRTGVVSFAQCGEDLIVDFVLSCLDIREPSYLDIGAHHPVNLSNTYYFYRKGLRGVCIEPDPGLFRTLRRMRKRDLCLNVGIGAEHKESADFFLMSTPTLNTFSAEEAARLEDGGVHRVQEVVKLSLLPINEIIERHFSPSPNFVSLDIEGLDLDVLKSLDFRRYRPQVFCVETLTYTDGKGEEKLPAITEFMASHDYFTYADTYINTIFVDENAWRLR